MNPGNFHRLFFFLFSLSLSSVFIIQNNCDEVKIARAKKGSSYMVGCQNKLRESVFFFFLGSGIACSLSHGQREIESRKREREKDMLQLIGMNLAGLVQSAKPLAFFLSFWRECIIR